MSTNSYVLMTCPPELENTPDLVQDGALIRNIKTGKIEAHMIEVSKIPDDFISKIGAIPSILSLGISIATFGYMRSQFNALHVRLDRIEKKIDVIDKKIDFLIGLASQINRKSDELIQAMSSLVGKIDSRYRDDVFAEVGAVLDTLVFADKKSPTEAANIITKNITSTKRAIRKFSNLIDEYENQVTNNDISMAEIIRMRFILGLLSIKIDLVLGEKEIAVEQAIELNKIIKINSTNFINDIFCKFSLGDLVTGMTQTQVIEFFQLVEAIDGIHPTQRMASYIAENRTQTKTKTNNRFNGIRLKMQYTLEYVHIKPTSLFDTLTLNSLISKTAPKSKIEPMEIVYLTFNNFKNEKPHHLPKVKVGTNDTSWYLNEVYKTAGDFIEEGDLIATAVANDPCNTDNFAIIELLSPISGTIAHHEVPTRSSSTNSHPFFHESTVVAKVIAAPNKDNPVEKTIPTKHIVDAIKSTAFINAATNGLMLESSSNIHIKTNPTQPFKDIIFMTPIKN